MPSQPVPASPAVRRESGAGNSCDGTCADGTSLPRQTDAAVAKRHTLIQKSLPTEPGRFCDSSSWETKAHAWSITHTQYVYTKDVRLSGMLTDADVFGAMPG